MEYQENQGMTSAEWDELINEAARYSMIDPPRLLGLSHLALQAPVPGDFIEVGCWRGGSGLVIAQAAKETQPSATVWLCDTFEGVPVVTDEDRRNGGDYRVGEHSDCTVEGVRALMARHQMSAIAVPGVFPGSLAQTNHRSFSFAHLDCDVYRSTRDSFDYIWPRLRVGGILVMDDLGFVRTPGIKQCAVECFKWLGTDCFFTMTPHRQAVFVKRG